MAAIRFHLDEHLSHALADGLRQRGFDVTTTPEAGLVSADDPKQLAYCQREGRVIVSNDPDMLRHAASGARHAGIAYRQHTRGEIGLMVRLLARLAANTDAEEMIDRVEFLNPL